jgi:hypothetical protein
MYLTPSSQAQTCLLVVSRMRTLLLRRKEREFAGIEMEMVDRGPYTKHFELDIRANEKSQFGNRSGEN